MHKLQASWQVWWCIVNLPEAAAAKSPTTTPFTQSGLTNQQCTQRHMLHGAVCLFLTSAVNSVSCIAPEMYEHAPVQLQQLCSVCNLHKAKSTTRRFCAVITRSDFRSVRPHKHSTIIIIIIIITNNNKNNPTCSSWAAQRSQSCSTACKPAPWQWMQLMLQSAPAV